MEKRGYYSHFKQIISSNGESIQEPRKRFDNPKIAQAICRRTGNGNMTVYYCAYCDGYHIGKMK